MAPNASIALIVFPPFLYFCIPKPNNIVEYFSLYNLANIIISSIETPLASLKSCISNDNT